MLRLSTTELMEISGKTPEEMIEEVVAFVRTMKMIEPEKIPLIVDKEEDGDAVLLLSDEFSEAWELYFFRREE